MFSLPLWCCTCCGLVLCRPILSLWCSSSMHAMSVGKVVPQEFAFDLDLIKDLHMLNLSLILTRFHFPVWLQPCWAEETLVVPQPALPRQELWLSVKWRFQLVVINYLCMTCVLMCVNKSELQVDLMLLCNIFTLPHLPSLPPPTFVKDNIPTPPTLLLFLTKTKKRKKNWSLLGPCLLFSCSSCHWPPLVVSWAGRSLEMRSVWQDEEGRVKMFTMQNAGKEDDSEEEKRRSINATRGTHVPGEHSVHVLHVPSLPCVGGINSIIPSLKWIALTPFVTPCRLMCVWLTLLAEQDQRLSAVPMEFSRWSEGSQLGFNGRSKQELKQMRNCNFLSN